MNTPNDGQITIDAKTRKIVAYDGKDAMLLVRAKTLISALRMHIETGGRMMLTRVATPTSMLRIASEFTGKTYKRGQHAQALADVREWAGLMESGIPVVTNERAPS